MWLSPRDENKRRQRDDEEEEMMSVERIKRLRISGFQAPCTSSGAAVGGLPHPGLARSWAAAQQQGFSQQSSVSFPPGQAPAPIPQPLQPLPPQHQHASFHPVQLSARLPQSPTGTSAAAAALTQQRFGQVPQPEPPLLAPLHQQPPSQLNLPAPQPAHYHNPRDFQQSPPLPATQHQSWRGSGGGAGSGQEAAYSDPAASTDYGAMNSLLAQLHNERVRAGARRPWVEEPDDEDEDCCEDW